MKRKSLILIIIILFTTNVIEPAIAAVQPGTSCKNFGKIVLSKNMKIKCVKNGKKFIWKEVAEKQARIESSSPWNKLANDVFGYVNRDDGNYSRVELSYSPNVNAVIATKLHHQLERTIKYWELNGVIFPHGHKMAVFSELDLEWLRNKLPTGTEIYSCVADYWFDKSWESATDGGQCRLSDGAYMSVVMIGTKSDPTNTLSFQENAVPHELNHSVQTYLMNLSFRDLQTYEPCWFVEGFVSAMATYIQHSNSGGIKSVADDRKQALESFISFAKERTSLHGAKSIETWEEYDWINLAISHPAFGSECRAELNNGFISGKPVLFGYRIGLFMAEKFLLQFGIQDFLKLMKQRATSQNFNDAFVLSVGMTMGDWLTGYALPYVLIECGTECNNYKAKKATA